MTPSLMEVGSMTDLSPAAQAVLDAYMNNCGWLDGPFKKDYRCTAAVLRALDNQLGYEVLGVRCVDCSQIELIVAELEALSDD